MKNSVYHDQFRTEEVGTFFVFNKSKSRFDQVYAVQENRVKGQLSDRDGTICSFTRNPENTQVKFIFLEEWEARLLGTLKL